MDARGIAARPIETLDQTVLDWVAATLENDRQSVEQLQYFKHICRKLHSRVFLRMDGDLHPTVALAEHWLYMGRDRYHLVNHVDTVCYFRATARENRG